MRKIKLFILCFLFTIHSQIYATDAGILWWVEVENIKEWKIHADDIPKIISFAIDYLMWFSATIAIIFIIIWAYQLLFWSLEWWQSKWKETIMLALWGFALASLSWIILKVIIDNFS